MSYLIYSDVSLDIDKDFAASHDIGYVPMEYVLGEETFYCKEPESDEMMHDFYEKLRNKIKTQTSQITPNHYMELFEPLVKEGKSLIYLSLSSGLSNTYESALLAVQNLKSDYDNVNIEVVDTYSATGGMGLLVESAFANMEAGMSLEENAEWLRKHAMKVNLWFKVEDLMYLKRGGRVSAATAVMGTALNIKPILRINTEGKLETIDKKRGNKMAFKGLIEKFENSFDPEVGKVVYICGADCMQDAEALKGMLLEKFPDLTVRVTMLSPIIGAHTGPDMLALIHYGKER
ncbi:MAG: DegV family protein [Butyrivibrio sp.]|nr:DegV family protein [Butyrivibrio sp.]